MEVNQLRNSKSKFIQIFDFYSSFSFQFLAAPLTPEFSSVSKSKSALNLSSFRFSILVLVEAIFKFTVPSLTTLSSDTRMVEPLKKSLIFMML